MVGVVEPLGALTVVLDVADGVADVGVQATMSSSPTPMAAIRGVNFTR